MPTVQANLFPSLPPLLAALSLWLLAVTLGLSVGAYQFDTTVFARTSPFATPKKSGVLISRMMGITSCVGCVLRLWWVIECARHPDNPTKKRTDDSRLSSQQNQTCFEAGSVSNSARQTRNEATQRAQRLICTIR